MHRHWLRSRDIDLGAYLLLGNGEDAAGGRNKESILSDTLEAVFRVYIDAGSLRAFDVVRRLIAPRLAATITRDRLDQKSTLQERVARATVAVVHDYLSRARPRQDSQQRW